MEAESILTLRPEALRLALLQQVGELADCVGRTAEEATGRWSDERRDMLASYTESLAACVEALGQLETAGEV